jgi:glycosyltransferase involved in cell wall biosynthesis
MNEDSRFAIRDSRLRTLRVGFDGRALTSPAAGVRRYVAALMRALLTLPEAPEIVALGGRGDGALPRGVGHLAEPSHPPTNAGWTLVGLPRAASRARVDVLHAPAYTAPFWCGVPVVLTLHDVSYARQPEWYPYRRDWLRRVYYRGSAHAAAHVITDSAFSAAEITAAYGIPASRISVVPLGVDAAFAHHADAGELPPTVNEPYVLHVGDLHERRNLAVLVDAVLEARRHFGGAAALSLVLAGVDRGIGAGLCAIAAEAGMADAVTLLGSVSESRLHALYRRATALVYPSLYEGFGLPVLEAMASGTPVLASRAASIPEVLGDAGVLLDPLDANAWTEALITVVNDEALRRRMSSDGLARAATFTWERTARATLAVYRAVLAS